MSAKIKTREWDAAEYLDDEDDIRGYLEAAMQEAPDDAAFMSLVLGDVARARNIAELARTTGIARETLYKVLRGEGNPTLATVSALANALGFRLSLVPKDMPAVRRTKLPVHRVPSSNRKVAAAKKSSKVASRHP